MARDTASRFPIAGVEGGLSAARLIGRDLDLDAEVLEHLDRCARDPVEKGVGEAGRHEPHAAPRSGHATARSIRTRFSHRRAPRQVPRPRPKWTTDHTKTSLERLA